MPKWLLPTEDGYISFVASKDLYKKFLGVAFSVVFRVEEKGSIYFDTEALVNGEKCCVTTRVFESTTLDTVWLSFHNAKFLWRVDDFGSNDSSHFQVIIRLARFQARRVIVKKCGFRLMCKSLDNDLELLLQDDQLVDPALLYEVGYEDSQESFEELPSETEDL